MQRSLIAALVVMVFICKSPGVAFAGTCDAKLVGNSYDCTILMESGETGAGPVVVVSQCIEFVTGGLSNNFDLISNGVGIALLSGTYGCECEKTSSLHSRFLHVSANAFECVGDPVNLVQVHGTVDSDELRGQGSEANGSILQFVCRKTSTPCE